MKKMLLVSALMCSLCSSLAYGENPLPSGDFWKTATVEDVNSAVANGVDVTARDGYGQTALMTAALFNPSPEIVDQLVKLGADINARDEYGWTPLMLAAGKNENLEVTTVLLEAGADINARDEYGWTPLMLAARFDKNPEVITVLLNTGAEANLKSDEGKTAFDYAEENEHIKGSPAYWELNDRRF